MRFVPSATGGVQRTTNAREQALGHRGVELQADRRLLLRQLLAGYKAGDSISTARPMARDGGATTVRPRANDMFSNACREAAPSASARLRPVAGIVAQAQTFSQA